MSAGVVERRLLEEYGRLTTERAELEATIKSGWQTLDQSAMRRHERRLAAIDDRLAVIRSTKTFQGHRPEGVINDAARM